MKLPRTRPATTRPPEKKAARLIARIFDLGRAYERDSQGCYNGCTCGRHGAALERLKTKAQLLSRRAFTLDAYYADWKARAERAEARVRELTKGRSL